MRHALRVTEAPVIFSHSSARAIADHPRNVPDDVLRLVEQNGGVVMVNFYSGFVVPESAQRSVNRMKLEKHLKESLQDAVKVQVALKRWDAQHPMRRGTIHDVIDHVDHIAEVAGIDHVGLGSDYDGVGTLPRQLEDVSSFPLVTQSLLGRGYREEEIIKILGGNLLRAMRQAERVSQQLTQGNKSP